MASIARLYQHVGAFLASLSAYAIGVNIGWSSLVEVSLPSIDDWVDYQQTRVVATLMVGACCGALLVCPILALLNQVPWIGPVKLNRAMALIGLPWLVLGWCILSIASYKPDSFVYIILGRFINGIGVGILSVIAPLYISDISDSRGREALIVYFQLMLCLGIATSYWIAYGLFEVVDPGEIVNLSEYSKICSYASLPSILCLATPVSPLDKILADENDTQGAEKTLRRLKVVKDEAEFQMKMAKWVKLAKAVKEPWKKEVFDNKEFYRSLIIVTVLMICQQMSGAMVLIMNSQKIFALVADPESTKTMGHASYFIGFILLFSSMFAIIAVYFCGRRMILIFASLLMGVSTFIIGYLIIELEEGRSLEDTNRLFLHILVVIYFVSFNCGTGSAPRSILTDSFPVQTRALVSSVVTGLGWLTLACLYINFDWLREQLTVHWTLWIFSGFSILGSSFGLFFVRDYRGKSLTDLHNEG